MGQLDAPARSRRPGRFRQRGRLPSVVRINAPRVTHRVEHCFTGMVGIFLGRRNSDCEPFLAIRQRAVRRGPNQQNFSREVTASAVMRHLNLSISGKLRPTNGASPQRVMYLITLISFSTLVASLENFSLPPGGRTHHAYDRSGYLHQSPENPDR